MIIFLGLNTCDRYAYHSRKTKYYNAVYEVCLLEKRDTIHDLALDFPLLN